jgi:hypothetical protein
MSNESAVGRLLEGPLHDEIVSARNWARTVSTTDDFELFLNPGDAQGLDGWKVLGMPIRQSQGVASGTAVIYDRKRTRYIRRGEQPTVTS